MQQTEAHPEILLTLPPWLIALVRPPRFCPTVEERMAFVIRIARENVQQGSGGPFGAAVFESVSGRLVAAGVNRVVPTSCSVAHAEMMALMAAQRVVGSHDLGGAGMPVYELVTSVEPCAMCFGAIPWSGVRSVVCGATDDDARAIGFDEGPKLADWVAALTSRGISVHCGVARDAAKAVLLDYQREGGPIYNGRGGDS